VLSKLPKLNFKAVFTFILFSSLAQAQNSNPNAEIEEAPSAKKTLVGLDMGVVQLDTDAASVTGLLFNLEGKYGFSESWAIGLVGAQSYNISGFTSIYTSIAVKLSYALWGSQVRDTNSVSISDSLVANTTDFSVSGLYLEPSVRQVFFNGSTRAVPLSGVGLDVNYQFGSSDDWVYRLGFGYEMLSNGVATLSPMRFHFGILYWL
jgi:hypothetical protein